MTDGGSLADKLQAILNQAMAGRSPAPQQPPVNPATGLPYGTGGLAPPRPDQQYPGSHGAVIAPGSPSVVRARLVIVSGTGANSGLFVYSGTPALGNPPIFWATSATADPFGNAISSTSGVAGGGAFVVGKASDAAQVELLPSMSGSAAQVQFPIPSLSLSNVPNLAGGILGGGTYVDLVLSGPALATVGKRDWVQVLMFSNDSAGTAARAEFRYVDDLGNVTVIGSYNNTGFSVNKDLHFDPAPGTIGWFNGIQQFLLPASGGPFINGESFHDVSLASGTTGLLSGGSGIRVKKLPWNAIWLDVEFSYTSAGGTTFTFGSLPDATYYPNVSRHFPLETNGNLSATTPGIPRAFVPTSGGVQVIVPAMSASGTYTIAGSVMYPTN